ncbi:hypothetical protein CYMTET_36347 [Cymbomonas tetramitiformis]|uniref:Uncharacterized protein n=1 Tax=Cymbomonas tetramitiformis TaxID=36881 RepID=A0AAE0F7H7_9CHLO|nr:hypothetical protein CYMTET_36347 [Cymbomonas tetramitiformis]
MSQLAEVQTTGGIFSPQLGILLHSMPSPTCATSFVDTPTVNIARHGRRAGTSKTWMGKGTGNEGDESVGLGGNSELPRHLNQRKGDETERGVASSLHTPHKDPVHNGAFKVPLALDSLSEISAFHSGLPSSRTRNLNRDGRGSHRYQLPSQPGGTGLCEYLSYNYDKEAANLRWSRGSKAKLLSSQASKHASRGEHPASSCGRVPSSQSEPNFQLHRTNNGAHAFAQPPLKSEAMDPTPGNGRTWYPFGFTWE